MKNIYLLKDYQNKNKGDIISVSNNVAFGLVENGIARNTVNKDILVKTEFGVSKAFNIAPSKYKGKIKRLKK